MYAHWKVVDVSSKEFVSIHIFTNCASAWVPLPNPGVMMPLFTQFDA